MKEAGTTTRKRENPFVVEVLLSFFFCVLVPLPLFVMELGPLFGRKAKPQPSQRERPLHKRKRRRGQESPPQ